MKKTFTNLLLRKGVALLLLTAIVGFTQLKAQTLPYVIQNDSRYADDEIYVALVGQTQSLPTGVWLDMKTSTIMPMNSSYNTVDGPNYGNLPNPWKYANIFTKLSEIPNKTIQMPQIYGCRIFIAFKNPLYIYFHPTGGYAGVDLSNPTDPNQGIRWELVELTWNEIGLWTNTSRVDTYQYPMGLEVTGTHSGSKFYKKVGEIMPHQDILQAWTERMPQEFQACYVVKDPAIYPPADGEAIIEQPSKIPEFKEGGVSENFFQAYIDAIWNKYKADELVTWLGDRGVWRGRVIGEELVMTGPDGTVAKISRRPTTQEVIEAKGVLAEDVASTPDIHADLMFQAQFSAAVTRHALDLNIPSGAQQDWSDANKYFQTAPYNNYVQFFHNSDISYDSKTYAFAYDDVFDHSSTIHCTDPDQVKIVIGGFAGNSTGCMKQTRLEAENWANMFEVQTEACTDEGGGINVGWIDAGDWINYNINIPACTYNVSYRVASLSGGGQLQLRTVDGSVIFDSNDVPQTNGWQAWTTITKEVNITQDLTQIQIYAPAGGYNINWIEFAPAENDVPVTGVNISQTSLNLEPGETFTLTATVLPENATNKNVTWTTNNAAIATVNSNGLVTAIAEGNAIITVATEDGNFTSSCQVQVATTPCMPLTRIEAENWADMFEVQAEACTDEGGGTNVGWIDAGDWINYNVSMPACKYNVSYRIASLNGGGQIQLRTVDGATVFETRNVPVTDGWQNWTTITEEISITQDLNQIQIYAPVGGYNINWIEFAPVSSDIPVTGVQISQSSLTLDANQTFTLSATVLPSDATNKTISWASDNTPIATVDASTGLVTAIAKGNANITVATQDGGFSQSCTVTVNGSSDCLPLTRLEAENYSDMQNIQTENCTDEGGGLNVGYIDAGDWIIYDINIPACTYNVSYRVASLNGGGQIQLEKVGGGAIFEIRDVPVTNGWQNWTTITKEVVITEDLTQLALYVPVGGYNINWIEFAPVENDIRVTGVDITPSSITVKIGESVQIPYVISPEDATNKNVSWSSASPAIASVSGNTVTGNSLGQTVLTVTTEDGGFTDNVTVNVIDNHIPVEIITLDVNTLNLAEGATATLTETVTPENASNKEVTWTSGNTTIATVNNGVVTAIKEGSTTITVASVENPDINSVCHLTVTPNNNDLVLIWSDEFNGSSLDANNWSMVHSNGCDIGNCSFGNQELQAYTNRAENVHVADGKLVLTARREASQILERDFTSGKVESNGKVNINYGVIEACIKLPDMNNGLWPAFWMLHTRNRWPYTGEIDIMEAGADAMTKDCNEIAKSNIFWRAEAAGVDANLAWGLDDPFSFSSGAETGVQLHEGYYVYRCYWTPNYVRTTITPTDANNEPILNSEYELLYIENTPDNRTFENEFYSGESFYVILNLAVGGWFPFNPDTENFASNVSALPNAGSEKEMFIDYVRVYSMGGIGAVSSGPGYGPEVSGSKFGIFEDGTETAKTLEYGIDSEVWAWSGGTQMLSSIPSTYGDSAFSYTMEAGTWSGFGINSSDVLNLTAYNGGTLRFKAKTSSQEAFRIFTQSRTGGRAVEFAYGQEGYGLLRDGQWHDVEIPLVDVIDNLTEAMMPFTLGTIDGTLPNTNFEISLDEIHYATSGTPKSAIAETNRGKAMIRDIEISAYPNPVVDELKVNGLNDSYNKLSILSPDGKELLFKELDGSDQEIRLNVKTLNKGMYLIRVSGNHKSETIRFIKQ